MQREINHVMNPAMKYLQSIGWIAKHLSPPNESGFPDILAFRKYMHVFIEVKDFSGLPESTEIKTQFTKYQLPWMLLNYELISNIFVLAKKNTKFFVLHVENLEQIQILSKKRICDIENCSGFVGFDSMKSAIDFITR